MALCLVHRPQEQARIGITDPRVGQSKVNRRLPQWQLPSIFSQKLGLGIAVSPSEPVLGNELKLSRGAKVNVRYWPLADIASCSAHVCFLGVKRRCDLSVVQVKFT